MLRSCACRSLTLSSLLLFFFYKYPLIRSSLLSLFFLQISPLFLPLSFSPSLYLFLFPLSPPFLSLSRLVKCLSQQHPLRVYDSRNFQRSAFFGKPICHSQSPLSHYIRWNRTRDFVISSAQLTATKSTIFDKVFFNSKRFFNQTHFHILKDNALKFHLQLA